MAMGNNARVLHSCFHPHSQRQDCQHIAAKQPWESWDGVVGVGPQRGGGGAVNLGGVPKLQMPTAHSQCLVE